MKVISRVIAYRRHCSYCGSIIEFDRTDVFECENDKYKYIKCPECTKENKVSTYEFCHFHLLPCVSEIFDNEVIAQEELPEPYNPKENNNESR